MTMFRTKLVRAAPRTCPKRARDGPRSAPNEPTPANGPRGNPSANQRFAEGFRLGLRSHNPKVAGSNPAPATMNDEGLADVRAANPFRLPRLHPGIGSATPDPQKPSRRASRYQRRVVIRDEKSMV